MTEYAEVDFDAITKETEQAILIRIDDQFHWIPRRLIDEIMPDTGPGAAGTLLVEEWFATQEGLI